MSQAPTSSFDSHPLRLVRDRAVDPADLGPFRLERRRQARWSTSGHVTAMVTPDAADRLNRRASADRHLPADATDDARKLCGVHLVDRSATGVGCWSPTRFADATRVTLFVPSAGDEPATRLIGHVVRCAPARDGGFTVGIRLQSTTSAA